MLVLARKVGETLIIGDSIRLVILEADDNQVRIGIAAPPDISVNREEVQKRLDQQKNR
ncbi:MAG TPA: carbon storage regulator CsrA [Spongiibacteraceae bacterium]|nr:carbon storage regulator CsrA [Spongiibacteraceae bacterium]